MFLLRFVFPYLSLILLVPFNLRAFFAKGQPFSDRRRTLFCSREQRKVKKSPLSKTFGALSEHHGNLEPGQPFHVVGCRDGPIYFYVYKRVLAHLEQPGLFAFFLSSASIFGPIIPSIGFSLLGAARYSDRIERVYNSINKMSNMGSLLIYGRAHREKMAAVPKRTERMERTERKKNRSFNACIPLFTYPNYLIPPPPKKNHLPSSHKTFDSNVFTAKNFSNASLLVMTGMCCQIDDARIWAQERSQTLDGHTVAWICHITQGRFIDLYLANQLYRNLNKIELICTQTIDSGGSYDQLRETSFWQEKKIKNMGVICHVANQCVSAYACLIAQSLAFRLYVEAHSRGALELYAATKLLPPEVRQTLYIYTLGAAYFIPKEDFGTAINYVNPHDPIPKCAQRYYKLKSEVTVIDTGITCSKDGQDTLEDHWRSSPGYQWAEDKIKTDILDYAK